MIKTKPLALAQKLKNIVDICEAADTEIENQKLIQKGALDAGKEHDGIEPAVVRKILARRKKLAKDPAETTRLEDLMTDYQFMLGEGREDARPWAQADDEVSRVMALTNTSKPPKIEAIKKALGCSQGKAHKLRSIAAVRLAKKSSSSTDENEHEHSPKPEDGDDGITEEADWQAFRREEDGPVDNFSPPDSHEAESGQPAGKNTNETGAFTPDSLSQPATPLDLAQNEVQPSATPSVGAVASESERVASSVLTPHVTTDDDLTIPAHLRGPSPANRRVA